MRQKILYILMGVLLSLTFIGCDVHEFPEERYELVPFYLHLDFSTELPLYEEIEYTRNATFNAPLSLSPQNNQHYMRYLINAYRIDETRSNSRLPDTTFVFTRPVSDDYDYTAELQLPEGKYTFRVWSDFVDPNTTEDKYYNTSDFAEIILADRDNHSGSNDYRDAFRGFVDGEVINYIYYSNVATTRGSQNEATVEMIRPMGKFKFISTDVETFLTRAIQRMQERGLSIQLPPGIPSDSKAAYNYMLQMVNIAGYKVVFKYNAFMPCSFNMFTDRPADSWTGITFESQMFTEEDWEMTLGYDYVFVNGKETTMSISVEVYDPEGEKISSTNPIEVPIVRSKLTIVRGEFLTAMASGGVVVNPEFNGEYNIEIQ